MVGRRIDLNLGLFVMVAVIFMTEVIAPQQVLASSNNVPMKTPINVGFILCGPATDLGWNYAHDQGRIYLESAMHGKVKTSVVENVPESAEAERVMEKMVSQGSKLIFATSYGYLEPALRVAAKHPDVVIMQCQRSVPPSVKNVGTYFGRQYEPLYVAGVVAGHMSKKLKLGYLGGHPVPPLIASLDAFALGARSINPKIKVEAVWTNSWYDPVTEAEATKALIDSGADVVACQFSSALAVVKTSEKNHVYSVGSNVDLKGFATQGWLTGQKWNWGPLYVKIAQSVINHTWHSANSIYGMKDGCIGLSSYGAAVPTAVRKEADLVMNKIAQGKLVVFAGQMKDRDGRERLGKGQTLDDQDLASLDWVVPGVEGPLPKGK